MSASAMGSGKANGYSNALGNGLNSLTNNMMTPGLMSMFAGNLASAAFSSSLLRLTGRGEKQNWENIAADAFGNALASKVVQLASTPAKASNANDWNDSISEEEWFAQHNTPEMRAADGMYASLDGGGSPNYSKENYIRMVDEARKEQGLSSLSRNEGEIAFKNYLNKEDAVQLFDKTLAAKESLQTQLNKQSFIDDKWDDVVDFFGGAKSLENQIAAADNKLNAQAFTIAKANAVFIETISGDSRINQALSKVNPGDQSLIGKSLIEEFSGARAFAKNANSLLGDISGGASKAGKYIDFAKTASDAFGVSAKVLSSSLKFLDSTVSSVKKIAGVLAKPFNVIAKGESIVKDANTLWDATTPVVQPSELTNSNTLLYESEGIEDPTLQVRAAILKGQKVTNAADKVAIDSVPDWLKSIVNYQYKK